MKPLLMLVVIGVAGCSHTGHGGATGAAPVPYIGERANVNGTYTGATSSSTMLNQRIKEDGAAGTANGGGETSY
jgi:hypothetical protein